jgi:hypothetical protein
MLCECGCGRKTERIAVTNRSMGRIRGEFNRFVHGHNATKDGPLYEVVESGCWEWLWAMTGSGYGAFKLDGRMVPAHRYVYEQRHGPIEPGMHLHHRCENRRCVNPDHLEPLTPKAHAATKRMVRGEKNNKAKLTTVAVRQIREFLGQGRGQDEIAAAFGVTQTTVSQIKLGKTWRHVI